jgi:hypothetical protein
MEKNNKLIAEFMGLPTEVFNSGNLNYYFKEFNSGTWYEEHELSYNISWDWLMPVVQKIEQTFEGVPQEMFNISFDISEVYNAVVEFINEYNKNK